MDHDAPPLAAGQLASFPVTCCPACQGLSFSLSQAALLHRVVKTDRFGRSIVTGSNTTVSKRDARPLLVCLSPTCTWFIELEHDLSIPPEECEADAYCSACDAECMGHA